jgi:hypothetical protein
MSFIDRRAHERVVYPPGQRPTLIVGAGKYEVCDCSERGLLVARAGTALLETTVDIHGQVRFPTGTEVTIEGVVLRVQDETIAIQFTGLWIPRDVILGELRRMKQGLSQTP